MSWLASAGPDLSADAVLAAAVVAVDPHRTGIVLRGRPGPVRDAWLALLKSLLPDGVPVRRIPLNIADDRLLGGLDLAATLAAGHPVAARGLLAEADGGIVLLPCAERIAPGTAARIAIALDTGRVTVERDALALGHAARFGVVALDEGIDEEQAPSSLRDRLAIHLDLDAPQTEIALSDHPSREEVVAARIRLAAVSSDDTVTQALVAAAQSLGVGSLRASIMALRVAIIAAALAGRSTVDEHDAGVAARLVLGPRATVAPPGADEDQTDEMPPPPPEPPPQNENDDPANDDGRQPDRPLDDIVLAAAAASIPPGLLARLKLGLGRRATTSGKSGAFGAARMRGRPLGSRRGELRAGARLSVIETLRAAAPWQRVRRAEGAPPGARVEVRRDDFRIRRFKRRDETVTIFVVDASGSSALHRLAEAKGAIELLLADCYIRRDQVALISFRGQTAEILLPPTRSLARARRSLAALPAGGGTPLASGLDEARELGEAVRHKGRSPALVIMTDGRANIARDGAPGRDRAMQEATESARAIRAIGLPALLVDTSPRPRDEARAVAADMDAAYLPLPLADAVSLSSAVRAATAQRAGNDQ